VAASTSPPGALIDRLVPLFGYRLEDYDRLYAEKLDLLLAINANERVTWQGTVRSPLREALVVRGSRADSNLARTGGNPGSSVRAGMLGLPIAYGILGERPSTGLPRLSSTEKPQRVRATILSASTSRWPRTASSRAREPMPKSGSTAMSAPPSRCTRRSTVGHAGSRPRIIRGGRLPRRHDLRREPQRDRRPAHRVAHQLGHSRHILQMDLGHITMRELLQAVELLGTEVAPQVRRELDR